MAWFHLYEMLRRGKSLACLVNVKARAGHAQDDKENGMGKTGGDKL